MYKKPIEYLPSELASITEFQEISKMEYVELENIEKEQERLLDENFITTATEFGIKKQEELFRIRADATIESLEFRRLRLLNRKQDRVPFTYRFLEQKLDSLFGYENYSLEVIYHEYVVKIDIHTFDWNTYDEIINHFRKILPCNMQINSTIINRIEEKVYFGSTTFSGETITVYPWQPKDISSHGMLHIGIGSNISAEGLTIYPKEG